MNFKNKKQAFTLVELIIAMTIFSVFIAVVSSSYLFLTRGFRDAQIVKSIHSEVSSVMNDMVSELRASRIDYDCYKGDLDSVCSYYVEPNSNNNNADLSGILSSNYLVLRSVDGKTRTFFRIEKCLVNECNENLYKLQILKKSFNGTAWISQKGYEGDVFKNMNIANVLISEGRFYITPMMNPFDSASISNDNLQYQPQVTIDLEFQSSSQLRQKIQFPVQTTVSTRVYGQ